MKSKISRYYSLFFSFCILASLITSTYQNLNTPISKSNIKYCKHISFTDKEKNTTYSDFLFEENENETSIDYKLWTNLLPNIVAQFQFEVVQPTIYHTPTLAAKQTNPIYILVCDFRI